MGQRTDFISDETGLFSPGIKVIIIFFIFGFVIYGVGKVLYVQHSVTSGAQEAATAAADEIFQSHNDQRAESIAREFAKASGAEMTEFQVFPGRVEVKLESNYQFETLSKIGFVKHYIVTVATGDAEIKGSNQR